MRNISLISFHIYMTNIAEVKILLESIINIKLNLLWINYPKILMILMLLNLNLFIQTFHIRMLLE